MNGSHYICRIVDCLKNQTFKDFETVIVIDEKSTDDSIAKTEEAISSLPNSKIIMQRDNGKLGQSRNIGLENAQGDLVWFLDVDDIPNREFLNIMTKIQDEFGADVTVCNYTYSGSCILKWKNITYDKKDVDVMNSAEALRRRSIEKLPVQTWCKLVRRSLLTENNIKFDKGLNEDIAFTHRILSAAKTVCYYRKSLYSYQVNKDSVCTDPYNRDARGLSEIKIYTDLESDNDDDETKLRSTLVRIRSSGHMSFAGFLKYSRSAECRKMCARNVKKFNPEIFWYLHSPRTYYFAEHLYFKLFFYRNGRKYTR